MVRLGKSKWAALLIATAVLNAPPVLAKHLVSVITAEAVLKPVKLKVPAQVEAKLDASSNSSFHAYFLSVQLPGGATTSASIGSSVNIALPVVRNRETKAEVVSIEKGKLKLRLTNQVQQLEGQTLTAEVPLKNEGLFLIPPQAVYSPRGAIAQVFVLTNDQTTQSIPITVLQVANDGRVLVASPNLSNSKVVFRGLENLITGTSVQVVESEGAKP